MNWILEINREFRHILKTGYNKGKVRLSEDQISNVELLFVPYTNIMNRKRVLITPPLGVITGITEDLYKKIRKIYPKYYRDINNHFGLN
jgi:hypothetical protein